MAIECVGERLKPFGRDFDTTVRQERFSVCAVILR